MNKSELIDIILDEINLIQGDIILNRLLISEQDEKLDEAISSNDIMKELKVVIENNELRTEYNNKLHYLDGKVDAFVNLLKKIK
jgi:hypothetical protein